MRIGVAGIELPAQPQGLLPVLAELRVQAAEQAQSALALAARPSEVVPEELNRIGCRAGSALLHLVLLERPEALHFRGSAAKPDRRGHVVLHLGKIPHFRWASTTYVGPEGVHDGTHDN